MNGKEFVIEELEKDLKQKEEFVEKETKRIKHTNNYIAQIEIEIAIACSQIAGLKDALHKLKGLDNLEKKNKIADPAGSQGIRIAPLYDELKKEAKRRGE